MAFDFHQDMDRYFSMQHENAEEYVIPFIREYVTIKPTDNVLEIGCAEGGVLKAFTDQGCTGVGVELVPQRLESAKKYLAKELETGKITLVAGDIYDIDPKRDLDRSFDLIILKDVIEHIPDQGRLLGRLHDFLTPHGHIFLGFPPWQMPFGGHQQICRNPLLSKLPYYHLLPAGAYHMILRAAGEPPEVVKELLEIKETGLSIGQFETLARSAGYQLLGKQLYLINPIYKYKFKLNPRKQNRVLGGVPYLRNFVSTCAYYLLGK